VGRRCRTEERGRLGERGMDILEERVIERRAIGE
jgi:hypothetical protein